MFTFELIPLKKASIYLLPPSRYGLNNSLDSLTFGSSQYIGRRILNENHKRDNEKKAPSVEINEIKRATIAYISDS